MIAKAATRTQPPGRAQGPLPALKSHGPQSLEGQQGPRRNQRSRRLQLNDHKDHYDVHKDDHDDCKDHTTRTSTRTTTMVPLCFQGASVRVFESQDF